MSPWVIAGPVLAITLGLLSWLGYRIWKMAYVPWKTYQADYAQMDWYGAGDPAFIYAALQAATRALMRHTIWGDRVVYVKGLASIYVKDTKSWHDTAGQKVAGQQAGRVLYVGIDLAALCHELAHLCDAELDKRVEYDHASWTQRGIFTAVNEYEAWLLTQAAARTVS